MQETPPPRLLPWKQYIVITLESILTFYLATFCMALFFTQQGEFSYISCFLLIVLYLFVIGVCIKRLIQNLPIPALMLIIPIAPLIALFCVLSLIPLIQYLSLSL